MDCAPIPERAADVLVPRTLLESLVADAPVQVALRPGTGHRLDADWWEAGIDALGIAHCDFGLDAALIGLVGRVRAALRDGLLDTADPGDARLVLRLHLASLDGTLGKLLERSAVYEGREEAAAEARG
jgi:hypothetical protein